MLFRLQTAFSSCDLIEQAKNDGEKVNNNVLAKQVGIEVEKRNTEEKWNVAYKRRVVSVCRCYLQCSERCFSLVYNGSFKVYVYV